jgi:hypothetical protein
MHTNTTSQSSHDFEVMETRLEELRAELLSIISDARDQQELTDKIFQVSRRYNESSEILELIIYLNSVTAIDIKSLKEGLVRVINSIILIKKSYLRKLISIDIRVQKLEAATTTPTNMFKVFGVHISPGILFLAATSVVLMLFILFSKDDKAANAVVNTLKEVSKVKEE